MWNVLCVVKCSVGLWRISNKYVLISYDITVARVVVVKPLPQGARHSQRGTESRVALCF